MVDEKRAIFMFKDGSMAWDAKDFLIEQEELLECTLENRPYYGKFTSEVFNLYALLYLKCIYCGHG